MPTVSCLTAETGACIRLIMPLANGLLVLFTLVSFSLLGCGASRKYADGARVAAVPPSVCPNGDGVECAARCASGEGQSCSLLGVMYRTGLGVDKDDAKAVAAFKQACESGEPEGCRFLAWCYHEGRGVSKDEAQVRTLIETAYREQTARCDGGNARACFEAAYFHESTLGMTRDLVLAKKLQEKAFSLYETECAKGNAESCMKAGIFYTGGYGRREPRKVRAYMEQSCDMGYAFACFLLGNNIAGRDYMIEDPVEVAAIMRMACEMGAAQACERLGRLHLEGKGVPKDERKAFTSFRKACEGPGDERIGSSCFMASTLAPSGTDVALALREKACALGMQHACAKVLEVGGDAPKEERKRLEVPKE